MHEIVDSRFLLYDWKQATLRRLRGITSLSMQWMSLSVSHSVYDDSVHVAHVLVLPPPVASFPNELK